MLERAHFSSNLSFSELQNFEFEHIASSRFFHFSSLSSSLETSFPSFGPNISSISNFIEFEFLPFFEFELKFGDKFPKNWPEYFKYFKFYQVQVCFKHRLSSSNLIEFEI